MPRTTATTLATLATSRISRAMSRLRSSRLASSLVCAPLARAILGQIEARNANAVASQAHNTASSTRTNHDTTTATATPTIAAPTIRYSSDDRVLMVRSAITPPPLALWTLANASPGEALNDDTMAQAAVAHRHRLMIQLGENRADDARPGEDDFGSRRLEPHDLAPFFRAPGSIELDLPIQLDDVEDRSVHHVRLVVGKAVLHRGEVGGGTADGDDRVGSRSAVEAIQF